MTKRHVLGDEISVAPGIMVNTTNDASNYRSGTEFHLDFTANQFLAKTFAIGLRGYYYRQLTGDSGNGAILGDFKGKSVGIGPGFVWSILSRSANNDSVSLIGCSTRSW